MRDKLALASMLSSVAGIEKTTANGYKGIIKVTIKSTLAMWSDTRQQLQGCLRLQKTITVAINRIDSLVVGNTDVVRLDADDFSQLGVDAIHDDISFASPTY